MTYILITAALISTILPQRSLSLRILKKTAGVKSFAFSSRMWILQVANARKLRRRTRALLQRVKSSNLKTGEWIYRAWLLVKRDYRLSIAKCFGRTAARTFDTSATEIVVASAAFRSFDIFRSGIRPRSPREYVSCTFDIAIYFHGWQLAQHSTPCSAAQCSL